MGAVDWAALGFIGKPEYVSAAKDYGIVPGSGIDYTAKMAQIRTELAGSRKTLVFEGAGEVLHDDAFAVQGFCLLMYPNVALTALSKTGKRVHVTGEHSQLEGGEVRNKAMRRYRIASIAQPGGANTAVTITLLQADIDEFGAHPFVAGQAHYNQGIVLTAGTWNNLVLTVASVTANTVTYEARTATIDTAVSYPYDRLDGHGRTIYPCVYQSRTQASADAAILVADAVKPLVRGVLARWAATNGIYTTRTTGFRYESMRVMQTAADGLFTTDESGDGIILFPELEECGDDFIAFVGYKQHGGRVRDITVFGPKIRNQWFHGRGVTWVGTQNVRVFGLQAEDIYGAAILMARDAGAATYGNIGAVCDGFSIKTAGNSGAVPNGWGSNVHGAIAIGNGSDDIDGNVSCVIQNGKVWNSRYRFVSGNTTPAQVSMGSIEFKEGQSNGMQISLHEATLSRLSFDRVSQQAIAWNQAQGGLVKQLETRISNVNVGTRRYIDAISVASGTISGSFSPGQSSLPVATDQIIIQGVSSAYATASSEDAEVAKDFAINGAWTLATVDGDDFTITGTGLADTNHARVRTPGQPSPHAYLSLAAGAASSTDGISADSDLFGTGNVYIEGVRYGELLWPMERTHDDSAGADSHKLVVLDVSVDGANAIGGGGEMLYFPQARAQTTTVSADSNQSIDISWIRRGQYVRSGLTAGRSDTLPTGAEIVRAMRPRAHGSFSFEWDVLNLSAQVLTLLTNTGLTLSGTMTVAANTRVVFTVQITNATPGSEAVTITRRWSQSGLGT